MCIHDHFFTNVSGLKKQYDAGNVILLQVFVVMKISQLHF